MARDTGIGESQQQSNDAYYVRRDNLSPSTLISRDNISVDERPTSPAVQQIGQQEASGQLQQMMDYASSLFGTLSSRIDELAGTTEHYKDRFMPAVTDGQAGRGTPGIWYSSASAGGLFVSNDTDDYDPTTGLSSTGGTGTYRFKLGKDGSVSIVDAALTITGALGYFSLGVVPPVHVSPGVWTGTGIGIDYTGIQGLNASVIQASLSAVTGGVTAGGGTVSLDVNGIGIVSGSGNVNKIRWTDPTYQFIYSSIWGDNPSARHYELDLQCSPISSGFGDVATVNLTAKAYDAGIPRSSYLSILNDTSFGVQTYNMSFYLSDTLTAFLDGTGLVIYGSAVGGGIIEARSGAPKLKLTDTTASAKSLLLTVDSNLATFGEVTGGTFLTLDLANKRVGINKTPGSFDLDVNGAVNFGSTLRLPDGNIVGWGGTNNGIVGSNAAGTLDLYTNNASHLHIDASGNVTNIVGLTLSGDLTISTHNIVTDGTTGTKIGTATTQKLGFFNAAPIVQPSGAVLTALSNLGLVASPTLAASALSNGTTGSGAIVLATAPSIAAATLTGDLTISTHDIITDTVTGTHIGTGATQKMGFWGAAPVAQPNPGGNTNYTDAGATVMHSAGTSTGGLGSTAYTFADIVRGLKQAGIFKQ